METSAIRVLIRRDRSGKSYGSICKDNALTQIDYFDPDRLNKGPSKIFRACLYF